MRRIFIDPGHGGTDPGATGNGLRESEIVLDVSLRLEQLLRSAGLDVRLSRRNDTLIAIGERWQNANSWSADLFISIHGNGFKNDSANGTETYIFDNASARAQESRRLATSIQNSLVARLGTRDRGVRLDGQSQHTGGLPVLRNTSMPAVLCELAFLTAAAQFPDVGALRNRRQDMAQAIADGIFAHLGTNAPAPGNNAASSRQQDWIWPVPTFFRTTDLFGMRMRNGVQQMHNGIDIARDISPPRDILGATIVAVADGRVSLANFSASAGNWIIVDHDGGVQSVYMHNQANTVRAGQDVRQGQSIGMVGNTGDSTAPHLHFERRENGRPVDPLPFINHARQAPAQPPLQTATSPPSPPPQSATSPDGFIRVWVGDFSSREEAEAVSNKIRASGIRDAREAFPVQNGNRWRVQTTATRSREGAEALAKKLRKRNFGAVSIG